MLANRKQIAGDLQSLQLCSRGLSRQSNTGQNFVIFTKIF